MIWSRKYPARIAALGLLLASLTGCDNSTVADTLGLNVPPPDEFTVVSRPPLSVPPEFNLRPPAPGEAPRGTTTAEQAHGLLLGQEAKIKETPDSMTEPKTPTAVTPVLAAETPSGAAAAFLKRAGAENASTDIRTQLGGDALKPVENPNAGSLLEKLQGREKNEPVVDAKKEAERLRNNKDAGKPVTEGETPNAQERKPRLIDKIF